MNNVYWGVFIVIVCVCGYYLAFRSQQKNKLGMALAFLMVCGLILRVYASFDFYLHEWDERYHALVAKHLMNHFLKPTLYEKPLLPYVTTEWPINHIWVHKQPLPLWLMAMSLKVFGVHVWALRIPSILMTTLGIKLIYDITKYLYNSNVAFIAAFLFSIHGAIIELAAGRHATDHVDIAFLFFVLLAVWFAVKHLENRSLGTVVSIGGCIGAAVLCKWLPAFIVLPVWWLLAYKHFPIGKIIGYSLVIVITAVVVFLPWQLFILSHYHTEAMYEYTYNARHISEVLCEQGGNFFYHFNCLRMSFGEFIYLPVLWYTYVSLKDLNFNGLAILVWFWLPYLFFSYCATKMSAYTLFAAPAIFVITAAAYYNFKDGIQFVPRWLTLIFVYGLLILPVRYSIERIKPFTIMERDPQWNIVIEKFAKSKDNTPKTVVFQCDHFIETMFATDAACYNFLPADTTIDRLKGQGYTILVQNDSTFTAR